MERIEIDGINLHVTREGRVQWASDWTNIHKLVTAGKLVRVCYGPSTYGHTDIFLPGREPRD